jgi:hypothetical protein
MEERISGVPMTERRKRIGAVKDTAIKIPLQQVRQIDAGMWKGPSTQTKSEAELVRYIREQRKLRPDERLIALRSEFINAIENAYLVGKGRR